MPTGGNRIGTNMGSQLASIGGFGRSGTTALSPKKLRGDRGFSEKATF